MNLLIALCLFTSTTFSSQKDTIHVTGKATYYASKFEGRKTTSGQLYRNHKFTAAHKTLPFGTMVKVTNLINNKSVMVVINDRGPFGKGLMIDLSQAAAKQIGVFTRGIAPCRLSYILP